MVWLRGIIFFFFVFLLKYFYCYRLVFVDRVGLKVELNSMHKLTIGSDFNTKITNKKYKS